MDLRSILVWIWIYDANGDRLGAVKYFCKLFRPSYKLQVMIFLEQLLLVQFNKMTYVCKKVKDGTHYNGTICVVIQIAHIPVILKLARVYENFPLMDIPDGTVVKDGS